MDKLYESDCFRASFDKQQSIVLCQSLSVDTTPKELNDLLGLFDYMLTESKKNNKKFSIHFDCSEYLPNDYYNFLYTIASYLNNTTDIGETLKCTAFVVNGGFEIDLFMSMHTPTTPFKLCATKEEAFIYISEQNS